MNRAALVSRRLHNQRLSLPSCRNAVDVVRWFGAVQSQDFEAAKWALALRMRSAANEAIEDAFNRGAILRTHIMRPTWHFVAHDDIRWLLELTAPRVNLRSTPNYRKLELDDAVFTRCRKVLEKALQNEKHRSRSELRQRLIESGVEANDPIRLAHILLRAELEGVIVSGPRIGKQFTYASFDERVPATSKIDRDDALAKLTQRYFRSHGPATLTDFVWWSGLNAADARRGLEVCRRDLEQVLVGEKVYWEVRSGETTRSSTPVAHLLPAYDEYFVAYKDRQSVFDVQDGLLGPTVIVDGTVAGTWKRMNDKKSVEVKFTRAVKKTERVVVGQAVAQYGEFLGLSLNIHFGEISRRR
jgi:hypothetical protein